MFLLCKNVKIVLRECSVGPKSAKIRFIRQSCAKYIWKMLNSSKKNHTTSEWKPLFATFRREASLSDLSFGLGWDLRLRILGLMVEWSGEQPGTQFPSGTSVFRMIWPFRSKSSTFRALGNTFFCWYCSFSQNIMHSIVRIFYFVRFLLHNCFKKRIKRIFLKELMVFFHLRPRKWSFVEFCTLKFKFLTFQYFSSLFRSKKWFSVEEKYWKVKNLNFRVQNSTKLHFRGLKWKKTINSFKKIRLILFLKQLCSKKRTK